MGDIIRDGIILIVYEFIIIISFIVVSSPLSITIASIVDAGTASGVSQLSYYEGYVNNVFSICMALLALFPVIWFLFRIFSREPNWGYQ